jgi:quercetin dioxygenase-like cupin family protein
VSRLVHLWTEDGQSRFRVEDGLPDPGAARRVHAEESPAGSALDWHDAPCRQYVITLTGTLRFTTRDGDDFVLGPGDVQPWRRVYVELADGPG